MREINHDVLILGTGLAGLRAAVEISIKTHGKTDIGIISKVQVMRSHYLHLSRHKKRCKTLTGPGNSKPLLNTPDAPIRTVGLETVSSSK